MRKSLRLAGLVLSLGVAGSAMAGDLGLSVSGDVHGATAHHFRGYEFSEGNPSVGFKLNAAHASGAFASVAADTVNLINDGIGAAKHQRHDNVVAGYATKLGGVDVSAGVSYNHFAGQDLVKQLNFSEVFVGAEFQGVKAKLSQNVHSKGNLVAGISRGDTFAELGYTYRLPCNEKFTVGGDLGYTFHGDKHEGVKDGLSVAQLRVGYDLNKDFGLQLTHQLDQGEDAYGDKAGGNNKTYLKASYKF